MSRWNLPLRRRKELDLQGQWPSHAVGVGLRDAPVKHLGAPAPADARIAGWRRSSWDLSPAVGGVLSKLKPHFYGVTNFPFWLDLLTVPREGLSPHRVSPFHEKS